MGGDVSGEGETSADDTFNATSLDTLFFSPTKEDYVQAVKSAQLQEYLKPAEYPSVYIITGMKIAREPWNFSQERQEDRGPRYVSRSIHLAALLQERNRKCETVPQSFSTAWRCAFEGYFKPELMTLTPSYRPTWHGSR